MARSYLVHLSLDTLPVAAWQCYINSRYDLPK
jgi:hypothetical protein